MLLTSPGLFFGHDGLVKQSFEDHSASHAQKKAVVRVVLADSSAIQSQLLTRALKSKRDLQISSIPLELTALQSFLYSNVADVVLLPASHKPDFSIIRWLHI